MPARQASELAGMGACEAKSTASFVGAFSATIVTDFARSLKILPDGVLLLHTIGPDQAQVNHGLPLTLWLALSQSSSRPKSSRGGQPPTVKWLNSRQRVSR